MNLNDIQNKLDSINSNVLKVQRNDYTGMKENVLRAFLFMVDAMFPTYSKLIHKDDDYLSIAYENILKAFEYTTSKEQAKENADKLINKLPEILETLNQDVKAAYEGDPACKSIDEIIICYPAFLAIAAYRIAHEIYLMNETLIARIISEYAHQKTGIDIHPGATIGKEFFIDHGTGVVIGETCTIGQHVKLYQHVTLGAKSFPVNEDGSLVKNLKRHPDIGNNVVIYAGATILGGDTRIGNNCIIGGNIWLTHSVEDNQTVVQNNN